MELEASSQKVAALEQALADAKEREASLDEAVASQVDAEILRAENARLTEALAARADDDALQQRCAELEALVRSAGDEARAEAVALRRERDDALQRLAAGDADAGRQLAEAVSARDEALQRLAANDADAGMKLADAMKARDEARGGGLREDDHGKAPRTSPRPPSNAKLCHNNARRTARRFTKPCKRGTRPSATSSPSSKSLRD